MQSYLQTLNEKIYVTLSSDRIQMLLRLMLLISFAILCNQAFADDDPFAGTEAGLAASMSSGGTIRKFIWMAEGIVAAISLISRNLLKGFLGIVSIEILFRLISKFAGIS